MLSFILKHRVVILVCSIVLTVLLGANAYFLRIDSGFMSVLPEKDKDFLYNQYTEDVFGHSDELIIFIKDKRGIYNPETLKFIEEISTELKEYPEVESPMLVSILSFSPEDKSLLKETLENDPFLGGFLVGQDGKSTMIIAPVSNIIALENESLRILADKASSLVDKYREKYPDIEIYVTGHPIVNAEIASKMISDFALLFPAAFLAVAVILMLVLRSFRGMLIPLAVTIASILWTFGLKGIFRSDLTITETVIPVILISIASADGIHIVSEAFHFMHKGLSSREAVIRTIHNVWKPVVLTSITTAVGFASFVFSPGKSLKQMGLFLAFGVLVAMLFSLVIIPILLSYYKPLKKSKNPKRLKRQYNLFSRTSHIVKFAIRYKILVVLGTVAILALSVFGILHINTETDEVRYFKADNPVRKSAEVIEQEMGGISVLQIVLESDTPGTFQQIENLEKLVQLEDILQARDEVSQTVSLADYVRYMFFQMRRQNPEYYSIPSNQNFLTRMLNAVEGDDDVRTQALFSFSDREFRRVKISVRLTDSNTQAMADLIAETEPIIRDLFGDSVSIGYAGDYLRLKNGDMIVRSQILSLIITIGVIFVILSVLFRSPLSGLLVSMPVIVAVLFNFAVMWIFKVSLNPATAIIAAVGLGVGVDYSIHLFSRFKLYRKKGGDFMENIVDAVSETSRGIISNALAVGCGFLILLLSAYRIINNMGWIIALSMVTTSLASLILLPVLIYLVTPKKRRLKKE